MQINKQLEEWLDGASNAIQSNTRELQNNQSIKSNFILVNQNFQYFKGFLIKLLEYIKYFRETFNIDSVVQEILKNNQTNKLHIKIPSNINVGDSEFLNIGSDKYEIRRENKYKIKIFRKTGDEWNTDNLIICVKNVNNVIVYPVIKTSDNTIEITFNDAISSVYTCYIL